MVVVVRALKWNFRPFLSAMFGNIVISSKTSKNIFCILPHKFRYKHRHNY